jgi:hypothetical protein
VAVVVDLQQVELAVVVETLVAVVVKRQLLKMKSKIRPGE